MANIRPDYLKSGERARLIPIVADTSREQRVVSTILAVMMAVPQLADALLSSAGRPVGKTARITCWTEVVFGQQPEHIKDRPDGLIVVNTGRSNWSALVEAKIGNQQLDADQVERYAELAKANGIDAVITISNQFVTRADHHPVKLPKRLANKVGLYHWPWMWVLTQAKLLDMEQAVEDREQAILLDEVIRFLSHDSTGISSFGRMNKEWKDVVTTVRSGGALSKTSHEVESAVNSWHEEERDLCLIMARHLGSRVRLKLERKYRESPQERANDDCRRLVDECRLCCTLQIPGAAADLQIAADLQTRTISCAMELEAPRDKKQTKARVNWLVRQLTKADDPDIYIRAKWPSKAPDTMETLARVRDNPLALQTTNLKLAPRALEVLMVKDVAGKFSGTRTFIEQLERTVPLFYDQVGQYLRAWQPVPPKPRTEELTTEAGTEPEESPDEPIGGPD